MSDEVTFVAGDDEDEGQVLSVVSVFRSDEDKERVSTMMRAEIKAVLESDIRADAMTDVQIWRKQRLARPQERTKSYPWANSSNICPPVVAQKTNVISAKMVAAFSAKRPFWSADTDDVVLKDSVEALTRFLNFMAKSPNHLNLDSVNRKVLYDTASLGTQFVKVPWLIEQWQVQKNDGTMGTVLAHNGPAVIPIRLENFLTRPNWSNIQRAPWIAIRTPLLWHELKQKEKLGLFEGVEQVLAQPITEMPENEIQQLETRGLTAGTLNTYEETQEFDIYECYLFFDANQDGVPEDIVIWMELNSGTILRSEYNRLGARPVVRVPYFDVPDELYAVGIGHMGQYLQSEIEFLHNHRNNSLELSLFNIFKVKRGAVSPNEELHPMKMLMLDNMDDFMPVAVPDLSGSTYQAEVLARDYMDRVTGANDPMSGYADATAKSGGSASMTAFLAQQGNSILNSILDTVESAYSELGLMIVMQCVANRELLDLSMMSPEDQVLLNQLFSMDISELPTKLKFRVETTDISRTEESKKQSFMMASQLYSQYGTQMMQLLPMLAAPEGQVPPLLKQFATQMYVGATKMAEKIFGFLDVGNPKDYFPAVDMMDQMLKQMDKQQEEAAKGVSSGIGGEGGGPGPVGQLGPAGGGMPGVPQGPGGVSGGIQPAEAGGVNVQGAGVPGANAGNRPGQNIQGSGAPGRVG